VGARDSSGGGGGGGEGVLEGRAAIGYDTGYDAEVFYLGLALDERYVDGFRGGVPGEDRRGRPGRGGFSESVCVRQEVGQFQNLSTAPRAAGTGRAT
jgi:hypothetical protein